MESVGVYLKKEREAKDISLGEVARLTKISKFYLDYIERDEFEKLPQGPYIKAYISSYSEQIGSDVHEALKLYDALKQRGNLTETVDPDEWETETDDVPLENGLPEVEKSAPQATRATPVYTYLKTALVASTALLFAGILILAGFGFYHLFLSQKDAAVIAAAKPMKEQIENQATSQIPINPDESDGFGIVKGTNPQHAIPAGSPTVTAISVPTPPDPLDAALRYEPPDAGISIRKTYPESVAGELSSVVTPTPIPIEVEEQIVLPADLKVLEASICTDVQDRLPIGASTVFPSSTRRVYVWCQIKADQIPSEIRHIYYFENKKISDVHLKVRSNFWRTWSYKTLPGGNHQGRWHVDIATADGTVLKRLDFTVN